MRTDRAHMLASMQATAFDPHAPLGTRRAVIRRAADGIEMVELGWGLKPRDDGGRPFRFVRAEGRAFPTRRCLIPASELHVGTGSKRSRVSLANDDWFYLAGIWQPAEEDWPEAYAVLTVDANAEVLRYQPRQGAVIRRADRMRWLDLTSSEDMLLRPLAPSSFRIEPLPHGPEQPMLPL